MSVRRAETSPGKTLGAEIIDPERLDALTLSQRKTWAGPHTLLQSSTGRELEMSGFLLNSAGRERLARRPFCANSRATPLPKEPRSGDSTAVERRQCQPAACLTALARHIMREGGESNVCSRIALQRVSSSDAVVVLARRRTDR